MEVNSICTVYYYIIAKVCTAMCSFVNVIYMCVLMMYFMDIFLTYIVNIKYLKYCLWFWRREESAININIRQLQSELKGLVDGRTNRARRFGEHMPTLLESIKKAHLQGRFKKIPRGPLGMTGFWEKNCIFVLKFNCWQYLQLHTQ